MFFFTNESHEKSLFLLAVSHFSHEKLGIFQGWKEVVGTEAQHLGSAMVIRFRGFQGISCGK